MAFLIVVFAATACTWRAGHDEIDIDAARQFDGYPLYWLGDRFERWDLEHVEVSPTSFSTFVYGRCTPHGADEPSCSPPLQVQKSSPCVRTSRSSPVRPSGCTDVSAGPP